MRRCQNYKAQEFRQRGDKTHPRRLRREYSSDDEHTVFLYLGNEDRPSLIPGSRMTRQQMAEAANRGLVIKDKLTWTTTRNHTEQQECLPAERTKLGYKEEDLFPWVQYDSLIPDLLHLRMRISNKLLNQVILWAVDQSKKTSLVEEMKRLGISFKFTEETGDDGRGKVTKWTQLSGPEKFEKKKILMSKHEKSVLFLQREIFVNRPPKRRRILDQEEASTSSSSRSQEKRMVDPAGLQDLWADFCDLMAALKAKPQTPSALTPQQFQEKARTWGRKFKLKTFDEDVIPYIHCMVFHVPEAMHRFTYISDLGIDTLERKNHDQHLAYFQSTSKEGARSRKKASIQVHKKYKSILLVT
ncbi:uncharacterized protein LOC143274633 [Babylonia areolata]|uniref:uncharacterized protein LOC143274633 n=1 Tax=Babylonia areolata TaxID=304850 RepID=UPI003FD06FBB